MSDKKTKKSTDDDFLHLLNNHSCDCNNKNCKELLRQYYENNSSIYPSNNLQLLFKITNPSRSAGNQPKRQKRMQQVYDRAASLLKVKNQRELLYIHIAITHFSPIVIDHYNNDQSFKKEKIFTEYLLPSTIVSKSKLGVEFTVVDKFECLDTTKELATCKKNGKCICNRYLNAPFVTAETNDIVDANSDRGKRNREFSDRRKISMAPIEAEVQRNRADRIQAQFINAVTDEANKKNKSSDTTSTLDSVKKLLTYPIAALASFSPLKRRVASLEEENKELQEKEEASAKRAKKYYDKNRTSDSQFDADGISEDELKRMGLCRQSLLDRAWHALHDKASRSLLNFESFDECIVYISVLFPQLRKEIASLKQVGAKQYVNRKYLTPLEKCIMCRLSPKMGIHDLQIGFIYGIKQPAVSRIKQKWMPLWGYAGKQLTDLELYIDYVENERPDAYYDNDLSDVGTQCDGKDFLCESFRRSSSLNRAQHSSKMKAAALRCITWSSLCGLVWAVTPLVLARFTENALVHWYGEFKDEEDMYVPISISDWDNSSEKNNEVTTDHDDNDYDSDDDNDGDDIVGETMVVSFESINGNNNNSAAQNTDEDEDEDEDDQRMQECYDDMSLSGCSGDESDDDAFDQEEDGCISLDKELKKFDKELIGKSKGKKLVSKDLLRVEEIKAMAKEVLVSGPDKNGRTKLEQLELLQKLHVEYEQKNLKKCLLSMYLKLTLKHRQKLIYDLKRFRDGKLTKPPKIPRRLAKLPALLKVLADRGFDGDNLSYPHFNMVITPEFYDKETKQFDVAQLQRDRKICELRYTCEVVFSRVTTEKMLSGMIPYSVLGHIEHAHCWAHAQANLRQPLQMPGLKSVTILGENYFD
ncbi:hypothetical protein ACHAWT_000358 [Skeletonema menzelii]